MRKSRIYKFPVFMLSKKRYYIKKRMIMAIYSGHKMISGKSRKKKNSVSEEATTQSEK